MGRKHRQGISMIRTSTGDLSDSSGLAEEFNSYFSSCVGRPNQIRMPVRDTAPPPVADSFSFVEIDEEVMLHYLNHLDVRKTTGTDGLSAKLLRMTASGIAKSLTQLFNYSLQTGQIPREWKSAHVTPVHKKGDKIVVSNYRPVSVLPIVVKIFEAIVHTQLYAYLEAKSPLHPAQSGFLPLHNTQHVLLKTVDDWRSALDTDEIVGSGHCANRPQ